MWDALIQTLSKNFIVVDNRNYSTDLHRTPIKFSHGTREDMFLHDCDFAIENLDSGEFCILSSADILHYNMIAEQSNSKLKKVLFAQYNQQHILENVNSENQHKYSPWIYFQSDLTNLDFFYYKRKYEVSTFKKKLYFRGATRDRPILQHFSPNILIDYKNLKDTFSYFHEVIQHKVGLSVSGVGQFCYRDIEYMAMGIPFVRFEYTCQMKQALIPNVHYISVPRPPDLLIDGRGNKSHALMIEKRYLEVIDDDNFLKYIANNARNYYEQFLQYPNNIKYTLDSLNIDSWYT